MKILQDDAEGLLVAQHLDCFGDVKMLDLPEYIRKQIMTDYPVISGTSVFQTGLIKTPLET